MSQGLYNKNFETTNFDITIKENKNNKLEITGVTKNNVFSKMYYLAADPLELRHSYSGSALPFHNNNQAFCKKKNIGETNIIDNKFNFTIKMPNSYYINLGNQLIKPTLYLRFDNTEFESIVLQEQTPYRYLHHPSIKLYNNVEKIYEPSSPLFYNNIFNLPYRTQEQILRANAYPKNISNPPNFWGLKPSL